MWRDLLLKSGVISEIMAVWSETEVPGEGSKDGVDELGTGLTLNFCLGCSVIGGNSPEAVINGRPTL